MSFIINFTAIQLSTYLDRYHYIRLGILIFIASIIVTIVNKFVVGREKAIFVEPAEFSQKIDISTDIDKPIEIKKVDTSVKINTVEKLIENKATEKIDKTKPTKRDIENKLIEKKSDTKPDKKLSEIKPIEKAAETKSTEKVIENKKVEKEVANNFIKKPIEKDLVEEKKSTVLTEKPIEAKSVEKIDKPVEEVKQVSSSDVAMKAATIKVISESNEDKPPKTAGKNAKIEVTNEIDEHLGSLDDILDYAYSEKVKGNLRQAIMAYQRALERYQNDDYAPFIAIDLGNIYKEQAAYTKVIKTYEEALKLPVIIRNAATYREFTKNLTYMRMVQMVLIRHRALATPFSKIPAQYLQEVENELNKAQIRTKRK